MPGYKTCTESAHVCKTNKTKHPFKSPLVPTVLLGKYSAGLPWRGAREARPWAVFPTCSRPLWQPPATPCLSARPHSKAAVGGPDPLQGTKARSSRNSSAWLMWEQKTHCGKPSWVSAAMRLALHPQAGGLREAPAKPVTWGTWQGGS